MRRVTITHRALTDMNLAREFYEHQDAGAGEYFLRTIKADVASLASLHGIHRQRSGLHQMNATTFPYAIYYRQLPEETQVVAVLDMRRDPTRISRTLRRR